MVPLLFGFCIRIHAESSFITAVLMLAPPGAIPIAYSAGKMRKHHIRILAEDRVSRDGSLRPQQRAHHLPP